MSKPNPETNARNARTAANLITTELEQFHEAIACLNLIPTVQSLAAKAHCHADMAETASTLYQQAIDKEQQDPAQTFADTARWHYEQAQQISISVYNMIVQYP